jgi:hypothetical protein
MLALISFGFLSLGWELWNGIKGGTTASHLGINAKMQYLISKKKKGWRYMGHLTIIDKMSNCGLFETITVLKVGCAPKVVGARKSKRKRKSKKIKNIKKIKRY